MPDTLASLGEFGLIARLEALLAREGVAAPGVVLGLGDDTAILRPQPGQEMLITCDCLVAGRHYLPGVIGPRELGRRAMAVNLSDIAAMGGQPLHALVSLGLTAQSSLEEVEEIYRGFLAELNPHGAAVVGGNITKTEGPAFIDVTLVGQAPAGRALRRSGGKVGDAILVTGWPGQAAAGLRQLRQAPGQAHPELRRAYLTPTPRLAQGRAVAQSGLASAMLDISDGLLGDLNHICEQSHTGALLAAARLPVSPALRQAAQAWGQDPLDLVLGDSDDYELIITCPPQNVAGLMAALAAVGQVPASQVGRLTPPGQGLELALPGGERRPLRPRGWDHFGD
ncbi:MAG: thiamine-phosphate kinase [Desulfarculus sp.]|nr:thiamine-phosphate kinase [Desulfarculus sp.]